MRDIDGEMMPVLFDFEGVFTEPPVMRARSRVCGNYAPHYWQRIIFALVAMLDIRSKQMCFSRKPDPVKPYMERLLGDEKWQGYFTSKQGQCLLRFFRDWLTTNQNNLDDEAKFLQAFLEWAESYDRDDNLRQAA